MTSAEPKRTAPYSPDIGWRIVWQRLGMNYSFRQIATRLMISVGTAHCILKRFEATGDVSPVQRSVRQSCRKLDELHELYVLCLILDNPGLYLNEICLRIREATNVEVSQATVCRVLRRNGYTRKKLLQVAKQRSVDYRAAYIADILDYNREMFCWIDETGCDNRDHRRKFGYALRGEAPVCTQLLVRGTRISAVAAICSEGLVDFDLTTGTYTAEKFADFVRGSLIPNMHPYDGSSSKSIAVLDNCSIHHCAEVVELFEEAGILVKYLPPYSPDLMPIEASFSYVKYYLKEHDDLLQVYPDTKQVVSSAFLSISQSHCNGWITHCGYN